MDSNIWNDENLIQILKGNGAAVMPTDTIYGIVGSALSENTVHRIYEMRKRTPSKPCIILIGSVAELEKFSIYPTEEQKNKLRECWNPGSQPTSVVLEYPEEKFAYLHRGTQTLAFRVPASEGLRNLLLNVGPLIAPSANVEKYPASENMQDAKAYFGDAVDLYVDGGEIIGKASKVIKLHTDGSIDVLRL